ncbi:hypothetical protein [Sphingobacterium lactis]|uniref:Uncharacterized protein n=1 Tax=Sphingobacterium lactis TaxID=797291 RepID=A0A1H5WS44_9SPHI|nr:hypothetical protein [Sphingobacterium lactis]SEG02093.1 hypothetical protein SAMN05421877_104143 [Sphingobacterium lactis]
MTFKQLIRNAVLVFVLSMTFMAVPQASSAQCAMCTLNAENSTKEGNTQGKGLNDGILFLLAMPFLIAAGVGFLWYKKFRTSSNPNTLSIAKSTEE